MKREFAGAGIAGIISLIGIGFAVDTAEAACRQVLAPNRWQYITVCDSYRSGSNYSGAVAAGVTGAAIALELLPGVLDSVGGITSGVGDITSGVVENFGNAASNTTDPLQNFLGSRNQNSGGLNDGTLNPFAIFSQPQETATPAAKKKNNKKEEETPSLFGLFAPQPAVNTPTVTVRTPHVNTPDPQVNAPIVNVPSFPNIFAPQVNTSSPRVNVPNVNTSQPRIHVPQVNTSQPQ